MKSFLGALICAFALSLTTLSGCQRAATPPPFDVAALVGLPIEKVRTQLGGVGLSQRLGEETWTREETNLTAQFKRNGRVTAFTLISREPKNAVGESAQTELLDAGKLKQNDARYSLEYLEAPDRPLFYNGVRIVPAPRTYQVQIRVSGPIEMLQISYSLPGATPPSETFVTFAPWDATATVPDDAQIQLSARTAQDQTIARTPILAEILVDGKVVQNKKASVVASCAWEL